MDDNNIIYGELAEKIKETNTSLEESKTALKSIEKRMSDINVLKKYITQYRTIKPVYDQYFKAKNKAKFLANHEADIIIFESAKSNLQAIYGGKRLPNIATLQAEYEELSEQKNTIYSEYKKLKKELKELDTVKANIDMILGEQKNKETTKEL